MSEIKTTLRQANISRQREWDKDSKISIEYRGNELAGEVGEACNIIKKIARERLGIVGSRATVEQLAEELADVVICADLIAMGEGIDLLGNAVPEKFNATSEKVGMKTRLLAYPQDRIAALEAENERLRKALEASRDVHAGLAEFILKRPSKAHSGLTKEQASGIFADLQRARLAADAALEAKP